MSEETVERFFWSDSADTRAKIAKLEVDRREAVERCIAFTKEVGAESMSHNRDGKPAGMNFKGRAPHGWRKTKYGEHWPAKTTAEGKALHARMELLTVPTAQDVFVNDTAFSRFWGVIHDYNRISFPTAAVAWKDGRVMIRCRMMKGAPPKRDEDHWVGSDTQHESDFVLPEGWNEWKEWEFLRYCEEYNARLKETKEAA